MNDVRRISNTRGTLIACGVALLWAAGTALADEPAQTTKPPPTKEQRESMAAEHDKIAACLRSDQDIEVCHKEMMKMHDTMMHHHSMPDHSTAPPPAQN
jgi:curli biogenesis system outer membrane secretion channel CsgG